MDRPWRELASNIDFTLQYDDDVLVMKQKFQDKPIGLLCFLPFNNNFFSRDNKNYEGVHLF